MPGGYIRLLRSFLYLGKHFVLLGECFSNYVETFCAFSLANIGVCYAFINSMVKINEKTSLQMLIRTNSQNQRRKYHFSIDKQEISVYNDYSKSQSNGNGQEGVR